MPDPRCRRGCRHPLVFVVALAACAVLAGACSLAAIAEWAADAPPDLLIRLGGSGREPDTGPAAPAEATVRSVLQRIDGDALDAAIGTWLAGRSRGGAAAQPAALEPVVKRQAHISRVASVTAAWKDWAVLS
ncbi:transposase family protein [Streptomyces sp. NPDC093675]|uniref:transposase family protein n=1 Tax=Streptomyces sp. NPDC093675 TaxID=3366049 RepID=UPI0037FADD0A